MQNLKVNLPRCRDCGKTCQPNQIFRLVLNKKKNIFVDLCPDCLVKHQGKMIKELTIGLPEMVKSGYYEQGARSVDFKDYLLKWIKKQRELVT